MPDPEVDRAFTAFVCEHRALLLTIAVSICGSRGEAEDLVQSALASAYARWSKIDPAQAVAYVRRCILNANISRWRRRGFAELTVAEPPEHEWTQLPSHRVDDRLSLLPLLRELPARQRAVLVLRYLCDLPDDEIAATLRIALGTVRSQAARGLTTLRARSAEQLDADEPEQLEFAAPTLTSYRRTREG